MAWIDRLTARFMQCSIHRATAKQRLAVALFFGVLEMTQREIEREIAVVTGESLAEIRRRGFSVEQDLKQLEATDQRGPLAFDWDSGETCQWPLF